MRRNCETGTPRGLTDVARSRTVARTNVFRGRRVATYQRDHRLRSGKLPDGSRRPSAAGILGGLRRGRRAAHRRTCAEPSPVPPSPPRWPTEWDSERPTHYGSDVPWPPPVPDPRVPVSPNCQRLAAMDEDLSDLARSSDPLGFAAFLNAPSRSGVRTLRIRLRDGMVRVRITPETDEGDLVQRFGLQVPRRNPPDEMAPGGRLTVFVPFDRLCDLANDEGIRRISLTGYFVQ